MKQICLDSGHKKRSEKEKTLIIRKEKEYERDVILVRTIIREKTLQV